MSSPDTAWGVTNLFAYGPAWQDRPSIAGGAGNATYVYGIGGTYTERLIAVSVLLTAAGGGTARTGLVTFKAGDGTVLAAAVAPFTVASGSTSRLVFVLEGIQGGANNAAVISGTLPGLFLVGGDTVEVTFANGGAGDTVGRISIVTEKFSTARDQYAPGQGYADVG